MCNFPSINYLIDKNADIPFMHVRDAIHGMRGEGCDTWDEG